MGRWTQVPTKKSNLSSNLGQRGGNTRNNRNPAAMSNSKKYFKLEIETFGAMLALRYERVDLKKYFGIF